jgi:hypothetical protein
MARPPNNSGEGLFETLNLNKGNAMKWIGQNSHLKMFALPFVLGLLLISSYLGILPKTLDFIFSPIAVHVSGKNDDYLNSSISSTFKLMVPVAAAKAAADVIEGGTVGVVEIGDVVQPVLDYLEIAWRILLLSLAFSFTCKYVLQGSPLVAHHFLTLSLGFYAIWAFVKIVPFLRENALTISMKRLGALLLLGYSLLAVVVPLTVCLAGTLSSSITEPQYTSISQAFEEVGKTLSMKDVLEKDGFIDKAVATKEKVKDIIKFCLDSTTNFAGSVMRLVVVKLLEGVIFPLGSLVFLIWLVRGTLYPALGLGQATLAERDVRRLINSLQSGGTSLSYHTEVKQSLTRDAPPRSEPKA